MKSLVIGIPSCVGAPVISTAMDTFGACCRGFQRDKFYMVEAGRAMMKRLFIN